MPFDPAATTVTRANAWWLAEAALLAYWDPTRRGSASLPPACRRLVESGDTQAYIASMPGAVIVTFRGSEQDRLGDEFDDARFGLVRATHGSVHKGFRDALDRVWRRRRQLTPLAGSRTVWFSGHSLGAALATLAADRFPTAAACAR